MQIENILLYHVEFWVQVHNIPPGLMLEKVGKTMTRITTQAFGGFWRQYMRLRVKIDVRLPLKNQTRVKNKGGE